MLKYDDHQVIAALRAETGSPIKPVQFFYRSIRPKVVKYTTSNGGSSFDGKRLLDESMISLFRNVRSGRYRSQSGLEPYFMSICNLRWLAERRKRGEANQDSSTVPIDIVIGERHPAHVYNGAQDLFSQIDEGCQKVLTASFFDQKRMQEITRDRGLPDEQLIRNNRLNCLKRLKQLIAAQAALKRDLISIWEKTT